MSPPVSSQLHSSSSSAQIYQTTLVSQNFQSHYAHLSNPAASAVAKKEVVSNSFNFWENYEHLCALQNVMPIQSLKASLAVEGGTVLSLNADKLR